MRLHLVGLPHTETTTEWLSCAYTQKVVKAARMFTDAGHDVVLYSSERNEAPCVEHVPLTTRREQESWFGPASPRDLPTITWNQADIWWREWNERVAQAVSERTHTVRDLVLVLGGLAQQPLAELLPALMVIEWGVGYEGIFSQYCAFESYAWQHYLLGKRQVPDGRWCDAVIPNFFDPADFTLRQAAANPPHLLFVGRLVQRKGPHVAALVAERAGLPLRVAGAGATAWGDGWVEYPEGRAACPGLEYIGVLDREERSQAMGEATALLCPTTYFEPFGGVAVEAMLCGTPVVATDWGAFTETVPNGQAGYRFRSLAEGARDVELSARLSRQSVRDWADQYTLTEVAPRYASWFERLHALWDEGWYT